jgi:hypothetical protein
MKKGLIFIAIFSVIAGGVGFFVWKNDIFSSDTVMQILTSDEQNQELNQSSTNAAEFKFVDLTPYANHDAVTDWTLNYANLPVNQVLYSARTQTPFSISKSPDNNIFIMLSGWKKTLPYFVDIVFNDFAKSIHFFGHIHAGVPNNQMIGKYVIHFDDSSVETILLNDDFNSSDWNVDDHCCNWRQEDIAKAELAWKDTSQGGKAALIREFVWNNPTPGKRVTNLEFVSTNTSVSPILAAITYYKPSDEEVKSLSTSTEQSQPAKKLSGDPNISNEVAQPEPEKKKIEIQWSKDAATSNDIEAEFKRTFKPRPECEDPNLEWSKSVQCINEKSAAREKFYKTH